MNTFGTTILAPIALAILVTSCGGGGGEEEPTDRIPDGTKPCEHPEYWPRMKASSQHPFLVHYRTEDEAAMADEIIAELDAAWQTEFGELGYVPPPSDAGMCGPDGSFDVFVWRDHRSCFVDIVSEQIVTPTGGRASYMLLDPWGPYGGDILRQTIGHELNHGSQAANDWYEIPISFEMTATYVEQLFGAACDYCIHDFQEHPEWSLLWDDKYKTWYMYGSALYVHFLRDKYFGGDERFLPELWRQVRNHPNLEVNSPNLVDAVNAMLAPQGVSFFDSAATFARWRYYTGSRDDGAHFQRWPFSWAQLPFMPQADLSIPTVTLGARKINYAFDPAPMVLGTVYLRVEAGDSASGSFRVGFNTSADPTIRWVVQAVPGIEPGSDGETLDLESGWTEVQFTAAGDRVLIFSPLPAQGFDPNRQSGKPVATSVRVGPVGRSNWSF